MEQIIKDVELGKDEIVVLNIDHTPAFILNKKLNTYRKIPRVCLKPAQKGASETLIDEKISKSNPEAGLKLLEIAKEIRDKEGVNFSTAIDAAVKRNPDLYKKYVNGQ